MKFSEAMAALEEGKKVRRKDWETGHWISKEDCSCEGKDCCLYYMRKNNYSIEWELYEEPEKHLTFAEVVKGLKEGKRFRRLVWDKHYRTSIRMSYPNSYLWDGKGEKAVFTVEDFEATDWIECD